MSSCDVLCVKSHKERVVIVPHELICMIHGLVLADPAVVCSLLDHNAGEARRREYRLLTWRFSIKAMLYIDDK